MALAGASFPLKEATELLQSKRRSDFVLRCGGHDFAVHQLVLEQKSAFFRAAFESDFKEKAEGMMTIGETTPEILAVVILHCYTNTLTTSALEDLWPDYVSKNENEPAVSTGEQVLSVYRLADRLLVQSLVLQAAVKYVALIKDSRESSMVQMFEQCYEMLPDSDTCLVSMLTALVVSGQIPAWSEQYEELLELVKRRDPGGFLATTFTRRRLQYKEEPVLNTWREVLGLK